VKPAPDLLRRHPLGEIPDRLAVLAPPLTTAGVEK